MQFPNRTTLNKKPFSSKDMELFSFDHYKDVFAIGYHDRQNNPNVCLFSDKDPEYGYIRIEKPLDTGKFMPRFSEQGKYLAVASTKESDRWDLNIYERNGIKASSIKNVENISFYDIRGQNYFFYDRSYSWVDNSLYFKKQGNENKLSVFRIDCANSGCGEEVELKVAKEMYLLNNSPKVSPDWDNKISWAPGVTDKSRVLWAPSTYDKDLLTATKIEIEEVAWFQPFPYKNSRYIAAQVIVRNTLLGKYNDPEKNKVLKKENKFPKTYKWNTRILIFKEQPE